VESKEIEPKRLFKAVKLFQEGKVRITEEGNDVYFEVESERNNGKYRVDYLEATGRWICSCPDFAFRNMLCKHILAAMILLGSLEEGKQPKPKRTPKTSTPMEEVAPFPDW